MSKLLRSELKDIVKECLVEILSEGIGAPKLSPSQKSTRTRLQQKKNRKIAESRRNRVPDEYGDIPSVNNSEKRVLKTDITSDPTLNAILADTAKSTLQEQISADRRNGPGLAQLSSDPVTRMVATSNPDELFGAAATSKWAQLAFFDEK